MAYEKRPNIGTLGKNKRKTEDKHPEYAGEVNVDGKDYWLSAWVKTNANTGEKFFSLSVKAKEAKPEKPKPVYKGGADDDSQIPF